MNRKLSIKDFELKSLKLNSKGGLIVDWFDLNKKNDLLSVESDSIPHDDLTDKLEELKSVFAESLGLLSGWNFARDNVRSNEERLREAIMYYNEEVNRCIVSGITLTNNGIKINGTLDCDGAKIPIKSPIISLEDNDSEMSLDAKGIVEDLVKEVWSFIYAGKRDADLFNQKEVDKSGFNTDDEKHLKAV